MSQLSLVLGCALIAITLIGFADMFSYSFPDAFLGHYLVSQRASEGALMVAYGAEGGATVAAGVIVLCCQSIPGAASINLSTKWGIVIVGQILAVASSAMSAVWPSFTVLTASRALHGSATALYMIYCMILLVELSPKQHLALGIATLSAGMIAGDSLGPVLGAEAFGRSGIRSAFILETAINAISLTGAVLLVPLWRYSPQSTKKELVLRCEASYTHSCSLPTHTPSKPCHTPNSQNSSPGFVLGSYKLCEGEHHQLAPRITRSSPGSLAIACSSSAGNSHAPLTTPGEAATAQALAAAVTAATSQQRHFGPSTSAAAAPGPEDCMRLPVVPHAAAGGVDTPVSSPSGPAIYTHNMGHFHAFKRQQQQQQRIIAALALNKDASTDHECDVQQSMSPQQAAAAVPGSKPSGSLDMRTIATTLSDPVILGQCCLLMLEQLVRSSLAVVLPAATRLPTWVVGLVYIASVVGSVSSPFAVDALLSRAPNHPTHQLSAWLSVLMGLSSILVVPFSKSIPPLVVVLLLYGASQAAIETLVYVHVARRLQQLGSHTSTHVCMCMYLLAQTSGGGIGSLTGGALQLQGWLVQVEVIGAAAGLAAVYGVVWGAVSHKWWR